MRGGEGENTSECVREKASEGFIERVREATRVRASECERDNECEKATVKSRSEREDDMV